MATIKLEIVTPEAKIFSDDVDMVTLTGTEGEMGILPQHMPLMTQLVAGEIIAQKGKDTIFLAVGDGFVQVTGDRVAILTDMAIEADNIDEAKAEEARQLAEGGSPKKSPTRKPRTFRPRSPTPRRSSRSSGCGRNSGRRSQNENGAEIFRAVFVLVGTPRCGVRSAQRADPAFSRQSRRFPPARH